MIQVVVWDIGRVTYPFLDLFDGPAGWADCLIRHGLLTKEETQ